MATSVTELILRFRGDDKDLKSTMARVRAELSQTAGVQETTNKSELQRSSAIIAQWKQQEKAAAQEAAARTRASTQATRTIEQEEKQLAATMIREAKAAQAARLQAESGRTRTAAQNTKAIEQEEKQLSAAMIREARAVQAARVQAESGRVKTAAQNARAIEQEEKRLAATMIREARTAQNARLQGERQAAQASASLQRQRSAALIGEFKRTETAAKQLATGVLPVGTNLQKITDIMQALGASSATLTGPLGGVAGRLRSVGTLASEAGGGLGIMGVAVAGAVVGVVALAAGAVAAAVAITKITISTADFEGKLFDLSQQTGVAVETLSTLEFAARKTGSNLDSITSSLVLFQTKIEDAQDPTSETAARFKNLGISANDTEGALRQALSALARMPEGFQQTNEAAELFGRRGAKQLLAILKETNGDIDTLGVKLRAAGVLITGEVAAAADEFNDTLLLLELQFRGLTAIIGNEAMPIILKAIENLSQFLTDNRQILEAWGEQLADAARGAIFLAQNVGQVVFGVDSLSDSLRGFTAIWQASPFGQGLAGLAELGKALRPPEVGATAGVTLGIPETTRKKKKGKAGSKQDEMFQSALEASKVAAEKELEQQRHLSEQLKQTFEENRATLEEFYKGRQTLIDEHFNTLITQINAEQTALDEARARGRIKATEAQKKDEELTKRTTEAQHRLDEETRRTKFERQRALDKAELDLEKQLITIREAGRESELQSIGSLLERQLISESEAIGRRLAVEKKAQADRILLLDLELKQATTSAERKVALDNEKILSEQKFTDETKRLTQQRIDAEIAALRSVAASRRSLDTQHVEDGVAAALEAEGRIQAIETEGFETRRRLIQRELDLVTGLNTERAKGLVEQGNIDLLSRPIPSISVSVEGRETLLPTVNALGQILTTLEAIEEFKQTGKHLGIFDTAENATAFAKALHEQQEILFAQGDAELESVRRVKGEVASLNAEETANLKSQADRRAEITKQATSSRILTEENAEKQILAIRLAAIDREKQALSAELTATQAIEDPGEQLKARARINLAIKALNQERTAIEKQGSLDIKEAHQQDLETERKYANQLISIRRRVVDIQRETARTVVALLALRGAPQKDIITAQSNLEIKAESDRHAREMASLEAQKQENLESNRTSQEQATHQAELNKEIEAEEGRHNAELLRLRAERDQALRAAGPEGGFFSGLNTGQLAEFQNGIKSFSDAAVVAFSAVGAAIGQLAQGFGQLLQSWVLLGSESDTNMKKMVASVLAGVAAQSAVLAVFELAKGFAALFFNPAAAAAHFTAAALFGSIAAVTAVAGRAIAGNDFSTKKDESKGGPSSEAEPERDRRRVEGRTSGVFSPAMAQEVQERVTERTIIIEKRVVLEPPSGWVMKEFKSGYNKSVEGVRGLLRTDMLGEAAG